MEPPACPPLTRGYLLALAVLAATACGDAPTAPEPGPGEVDLRRPWAVAAPEAVGADEARLATAVARAAAHPRFLSLLAVKDGALVVEAYFNGNARGELNDVRSVTKSVLSTLVGAALRDGTLASLDETLGDHLHPDVFELTPEQQSISVRHLLTMSGGFAWNESGGGNAYNTWILSGDHVRHVLDQPLSDPPGSTFNYNSGAVHLLGVLLETAAGVPLPQYADAALFAPLGIDRSQWEPLSGGYHNGGSGLDLRPRDLARIGQLYLQDGVNAGVRLLPEGWAGEATLPRFAWRVSYGHLAGATYGYLWWVEEGQPEPGFLAWGFGGQFIYVVPSLGLVVVTTTEWRGVSQDGGSGPLEREALAVILGEVVPAFR